VGTPKNPRDSTIDEHSSGLSTIDRHNNAISQRPNVEKATAYSNVPNCGKIQQNINLRINFQSTTKDLKDQLIQ